MAFLSTANSFKNRIAENFTFFNYTGTAGTNCLANLAFVYRKTFRNESQAQVLILNNPYRVKEKELINPGDQVIEHPKMGLNFTCRMSYAPLVMEPRTDWSEYSNNEDNYYYESDQDPVDGVTGLTFGAELDLAQFTGSSELYLYEDNTLLFNFPMLGGLAEVGIRKKFYKRRLAGFYGASLGAFGMSGYLGEVLIFESNSTNGGLITPSNAIIPLGSDLRLTGWTIGLNLTAGINYLFTPEVALNIDGGYRLYPDISGDMWTIEAEHDGDTWELQANEFLAEPPDAKISGLWYSIGFIFSL